MDFLKRLLGMGGGGAQTNAGDPNGMYFYVQPEGCDEIVRVRIDRNNDPSLEDDGSFLVRKHVRGVKCRQSAELTILFDSRRSFSSAKVDKGAVVQQADYDAWLAGNSRTE